MSCFKSRASARAAMLLSMMGAAAAFTVPLSARSVPAPAPLLAGMPGNRNKFSARRLMVLMRGRKNRTQSAGVSSRGAVWAPADPLVGACPARTGMGHAVGLRETGRG